MPASEKENTITKQYLHHLEDSIQFHTDDRVLNNFEEFVQYEEV